MANKYSASAPAGYLIDSSGRFVKVSDGEYQAAKNLAEQPAASVRSPIIQPTATATPAYQAPTTYTQSATVAPASTKKPGASFVWKGPDGLYRVFVNGDEVFSSGDPNVAASWARQYEKELGGTDYKEWSLEKVKQYTKDNAIAQSAAPQVYTPPTLRGGLTDAQIKSIQTLAQKPIEQWTGTDKANWSFATNNAALPTTEQQRSLQTQVTTTAPTQTQALDQQSGIDTSYWPPEMTALYNDLSSYIKDLSDKGKIINPDIEITPQMTAQFLSQAQTEVSPYYNQMFEQAKQDLRTAMSRVSEDYTTAAQEVGRQYGQALESTQESFARRGLAFSSDRERAERELAENASKMLEGKQTAASRQGYDIGLSTERYLGSSQMPSDSFSLSTGRAPILGKPGVYGMTSPSMSRSLYSSTGGITGEAERQKLFDIESRVKDLTQAERQYRSGFYQ